MIKNDNWCGSSNFRCSAYACVSNDSSYYAWSGTHFLPYYFIMIDFSMELLLERRSTHICIRSKWIFDALTFHSSDSVYRANHPTFIWQMDPTLSRLDLSERPSQSQVRSSSTLEWSDILKPWPILVIAAKFLFWPTLLSGTMEFQMSLSKTILVCQSTLRARKSISLVWSSPVIRGRILIGPRRNH